MRDIWVISDTHFGHENILKFRDKDGELIRGKLFDDIEQHDEVMIDQWNKYVVGTIKSTLSLVVIT